MPRTSRHRSGCLAKQIADTVWKAQHPLPNRNFGKDVVDKVRRHLRHPAARARGTDRAGLAAEGDQDALPPSLAVGAYEASSQDPTIEELG